MPFYSCYITSSAEGTARLGASGIKISKLGIGTLQWGDPASGFGGRYDEVCP